MIQVGRFLRGDFARHGLIVFASTMLVNALNYGFHFAISRRLGVVDYGDLYALLSALALVSVPIASLSMVVVRYSAEFHALDDRERLAALYRWVVVRCSAGALLVVVLAIAAAPLVARLLHLGSVSSVVWASVVLGLSVVLPAIRSVLQGTQDFGRFAVATAIEAAGKAILGVGFVQFGFGISGAFAGMAIGELASIAYTAFALRRHVAGPRGPTLQINLRRLALTTAGVTFATLAMTSLTSADTVLVKHFFSPVEAGLYSSVSLVGKVLFFVVGFIPMVILPKVTAKRAAGESARSQFVQATVVTIVICGSGLALLAFFPGLIVSLMAGHAFVGAGPYVLSYGFAMTLLGLTSVFVAYKVGVHRFDFVPLLLLVAVGEIGIISVYHPDLAAVIGILTVGHGIALISTLVPARALLTLGAGDSVHRRLHDPERRPASR